MNVLHVQKAKGIGGSERHLLELLPALAAEGGWQRMLVLTAPGAGAFVGALRGRGIEVDTYDAGSHLNPFTIAGISRAIRRHRPDLVHTHLVHADVYGQAAAKASRVPAVSTFHSVDPHYRRAPFRQAAAVAGRAARRTICISEHVRSFVVSKGIVPASKAKVVHYGIDIASWDVAGAGRDASRERFVVAADELVVGIAARLVPGKGHDVLFEAFRRARETVPELRLLVAGEGPERARLERSVPEGARLLGFVEDVPSFMAACDVVAFPTLQGLDEGFGLAALEAMACSRPVVASDIPALREVLAGERTGFLFPPGDASALHDALVRLSDPVLRKRSGEAARSRAATEFSLAKMVEGTRSVYREALA